MFLSDPSDLAWSEENTGQRLLDMEKHKKQKAVEYDNLEKQLEQYTAKNQMTGSELQYPLPGCAITLKVVFTRSVQITVCNTGQVN